VVDHPGEVFLTEGLPGGRVEATETDHRREGR
jgi:hypothetical protein